MLLRIRFTGTVIRHDLQNLLITAYQGKYHLSANIGILNLEAAAWLVNPVLWAAVLFVGARADQHHPDHTIPHPGTCLASLLRFSRTKFGKPSWC